MRKPPRTTVRGRVGRVVAALLLVAHVLALVVALLGVEGVDALLARRAAELDAVHLA